jgi:cysteine desulfurase/selenocysteine lyase
MSALETFKAQFDTTLCQLNNAGLSPISKSARDVIKTWADRFYHEGYFADAAYAELVQAARRSLAELIKTTPAQIAFFSSTAVAISQVAFGMNLEASDEVITCADEYGSNLYPWREACSRSGATLAEVASGPGGSLSAEALLAAVTAKTKVIAVSWVQFQTGAVLDLKTLGQFCQRREIYLVVDAIQGVGLFDMDFSSWGIDALCGGSHKWLVSPVGVGYLALGPRLLRTLKPIHVGAQSYGTCDDPTSGDCVLKTDASRFEPGAKASIEIMALGASIDLILATGVSVIGQEVQRLAKRLKDGLSELGYQVICPHSKTDRATHHDLHVGSIVSFTVSNKTRLPDNTSVYKVLRDGGISAVLRGRGVRLSPHAFNSDRDIDLALKLLS